MPHGEEDGEGVVDARVDVEDDGDAHRITVARRAVRGRAYRVRDASPRAARQRTNRTSWISSPRNGTCWSAPSSDEAVALVEAVRARVVRGDPQVDRVVADGGVEELLPDAGAVVRVEEVDEVELAIAGRVLVARGARSDEADDLAVDEGGELLVLLAALRVVVPELGHAARREVLECGCADQVVVRLVPAGGVDAAQGLDVGITDGTDDDLGNNIGAHAQRLSQPEREAKSSGTGSRRTHTRFTATADGSR